MTASPSSSSATSSASRCTGQPGSVRSYGPVLSKLGLTYPQYLTMLVLWEAGGPLPSVISASGCTSTAARSPR